jgi:hypothetical protein
MAEVAPVGSSIDHIETEDRDTSGIVVLVEDPDLLMVDKLKALLKSPATPGIERTTLELGNGVRRRCTLVQMSFVPVSRQSTGWPSRRVGAVKAKRVTVVSVDVYLADSRTRHVVARRRSIVADEGNNYASVTGLVLHILHVLRLWKGLDPDGAGVLVLGLIQDDWPSVRYLVLGDDAVDVGSVAIGISARSRNDRGPETHLSVA